MEITYQKQNKKASTIHLMASENLYIIYIRLLDVHPHIYSK